MNHALNRIGEIDVAADSITLAEDAVRVSIGPTDTKLHIKSVTDTGRTVLISPKHGSGKERARMSQQSEGTLSAKWKMKKWSPSHDHPLPVHSRAVGEGSRGICKGRSV